MSKKKLDALLKLFPAPTYTSAVVGTAVKVAVSNDLNTSGLARRLQVDVCMCGKDYEVKFGYFYAVTDSFVPERDMKCANPAEVVAAVTEYLEPALRTGRVRVLLPENDFSGISPFARQHLVPQVLA